MTGILWLVRGLFRVRVVVWRLIALDGIRGCGLVNFLRSRVTSSLELFTPNS